MLLAPPGHETSPITKWPTTQGWSPKAISLRFSCSPPQDSRLDLDNRGYLTNIRHPYARHPSLRLARGTESDVGKGTLPWGVRVRVYGVSNVAVLFSWQSRESREPNRANACSPTQSSATLTSATSGGKVPLRWAAIQYAQTQDCQGETGLNRPAAWIFADGGA